jgi:signal transduction histidine kinase
MTLRRVGLALALLLSIAALIPAFDIEPDPATGRIGPLSVLVAVVAGAVALVTIAFLVPAWRGGRRSNLVIASAVLLSVLTGLPAFFAPADLVPPGGVVLAAAGTLVQIAVVAMIAFDIAGMILTVLGLSAVVALYASIVAVGEVLVPPEVDQVVQTLAAVAVALAFPSIVRLLRRTVGRALYGGRADPAATATTIGRRAADGREDVVASAIEETARTLRLPRVQVLQSGLVVADSVTGARSSSTTADLALSGDGERVLRVTLRAGERRLDPDDRAALLLLAPSLELLIRESSLLAEMRSARAAVADAREREQLALHRDLHDGLGPLLTGALLRADAARNLLPNDADDARVQLDAARTDLRSALSEVRRVVYGLWPLELEQRGLWDAAAARAARSGASIALGDDRPDLPPAVELAAYRILSEALTNVDRHAPSAIADVSMLVEQGGLAVAVVNACEPVAFRVGMGLSSIRARADELGGHAEAGPTSDGWRVRAVLPLAPPQSGAADGG